MVTRNPMFLILVVLALMATVVVSACGVPTPQPTPTPKPSPATSPAPSPTASPKASPAPSPAQPAIKLGGTVKYPNSLPPAGFDSHRRPTFGPPFAIPVFNNLVRFDPSKKDLSPDNLQGDLASKWEVSPDGKVLTFTLPSGVKWHDGKPFTADDVVYSLDKMVDPKRSVLSGNFPAYDRSEKVNDTTVKVYLKSASPGFLSQLASPYASIQPKHKADVDWKLTDFLVGTGPFMFKSYTSGVSGTLVKNPNYFKKDAAGRQLPYLDALDLIVVSDRNAQIDGFNTKQLDMCAPYGGFYSQEHWDRIKQQNPTAVVGTAYPPQVTYLWINMNSANLKDQRVRKAIALLVDQVQLTTVGYGAPEWNAPGRAIFTSTYGIPAAEQDKLLGRDKPYDQRVAEAKQLMKDAGFASGFKIQLVGSKIAEYERQYVYFADLLKRHLNIDAEIVLQLSAEARVLRDAGKFDIWLEEMLGSTGDPDEVWGYLGTGKPGNVGKYSNPKVDALWAQQSVALSVADRKKLTQEIERQILTDFPVIPQRGSIMRTAWQSYVKGFNLPDSTYGLHMSFETTWLDK